MSGQAITPAEFGDICTWMEERWPGTKNFRTAATAFGDFAHFHPADVREAAHVLYREGRRTAPTFSEWMAATASIAGAKARAGWEARPPEDDCAHRGWHSWAIVHERQDGTREAECSHCHLERSFAPGALLTDSEIAARKTPLGMA